MLMEFLTQQPDSLSPQKIKTHANVHNTFPMFFFFFMILHMTFRLKIHLFSYHFYIWSGPTSSEGGRGERESKRERGERERKAGFPVPRHAVIWFQPGSDPPGFRALALDPLADSYGSSHFQADGSGSSASRQTAETHPTTAPAWHILVTAILPL